MAEREKIVKNLKRGGKTLAVGVPAVRGGEEVYHAASAYFGAKNDLDAIYDATADFGKATGELVFQTPEYPEVRGVTYYEGSQFPNASNAIGTAEHGRYQLLEAGLIREANRAQAIIREVDAERAKNPSSDFAAQRQELRELAESLNPHVARLNDIKNDQYWPAARGSVIALLVPTLWIGAKKWIEKRKKKADLSTEPRQGWFSRQWERATTLPSQKNDEAAEATGPQVMGEDIVIDEREPGWIAKKMEKEGKLLPK